MFCEINLPTKVFFDYLLTMENPAEVAKLITEARTNSEYFYESTFSAALNYKDDFHEFSKYFAQNIQPLAQKIIDLMVLIDLYYYDKDLEKTGSILTRLMNKIRIFIKQKLISNRNIENLIYLIISGFSISSISVLSFYFAGGVNSLLTSSIVSLSSFLATTLFAVVCHKKYDFELTDISGRNLIALKYRSVFYNILASIEQKSNHAEKHDNNASHNYEAEHYQEQKILELA